MTPSLEEALFALAVAKRAGERAAFLDRECAGAAALRARLKDCSPPTVHREIQTARGLAVNRS